MGLTSVDGIDQRGHRIIRSPQIFHGLMGYQPDPRVGRHIHRTISSSNLDSRIVLVTSKKTRILSHAYFSTSVVEIILN